MTINGGLATLDLGALAAVWGGQQAGEETVVPLLEERYTATGWDKNNPKLLNEYDVRCVSASDFAKAVGGNIPEIFKTADGQMGEGKICTFVKKKK